ATLGFRGEALPSIASVSRFTLTTRRPDDLEGTEVSVVGGEIQHAKPAACPAGTEIAVEDLFFNTPARLRFLKTEATERRHINTMLSRLALAHPEVHVVLESDGRVLLEASPCTSLIDRAHVVLGAEVASELYPIAKGAHRGEVRLTGLFGAPSETRRNTNGMFTFVNGRFVRDRRIQAAIQVGYSGLLEKGTYPTVVLHLDVPYDQLDVNVHPAKTEVRFNEPDLVFRVIRGSLIDGLAETPWVPTPSATGKGRTYQLKSGSAAPMFDAGGDDFSLVSQHLPKIVPDPIQETLPGVGRLSPSASLDGRGGWWTSTADRSPAPSGGLQRSDVPPDGYFQSLNYVGRIGGLYLLCEDPDGMVVIDQHAAHERITFERLKGVFKGHHREVQSLLLPLHLELNRSRRDVLGENLSFFADAGFEIEPFSDDSYILRAVPAVLQQSSYARLINDALDELEQTGHTERVDEAVEAVLSRMACHGSVRAGDRMEPEEVRAMFRQMDAIDFRANCPHGRPVYFRLSWIEMEKRFERR
ncbi:MAG: DNA mismatch repair endonuclease MutL, partial [Myxococcales bacterium]|nr:DNA mismatch repair endonuclease MutL [Myxococcales bacterium]